MADSPPVRPAPGILWAGAALVAVIVALAALASRGDVGRLSDADVARGGERAASADLRFEDEAGGAVAVRSARTGALVHRIPSEGGTFERGALRALVRQRKVHGIDAPRTFRVTAWRDGRLTLSDPATGTVIDLRAFGPTNAGAFARILDAARTAEQRRARAGAPAGD